MATSIEVKTPQGKYPIVIEAGILNHLRRLTDEFDLNRPVAIITNPTIRALYNPVLNEAFPNATIITMQDGEQYKTLETVSQFYSQLVEAKLDRGGVMVAFGGGVTGDAAGFAAASYLRGVRFVQIPTTLLAMVDSSVGGKVGVDLTEGKNLVGAFKQPNAVIIDTDVLRTLPERQLRCGMAEVIKHGLLADAGLLDEIETLHQAPNWLDDGVMNPSSYFQQLPEIVARAVQVKVNVVEEDPFEENIRAHLNLGHTFAHAIEQVSQYQWQHGEAVGVGLIAAAKLSEALGMAETGLAQRVRDLARSVGLPLSLNGLKPQALWDAMATDKKWTSSGNRFVVLETIGKPTIAKNVPQETVLNVLKQLA